MTESVFNKVADWKLATLLKKDSNTGVACEYCEIFKNSFFLQNTPGDCFRKNCSFDHLKVH